MASGPGFAWRLLQSPIILPGGMRPGWVGTEYRSPHAQSRLWRPNVFLVALKMMCCGLRRLRDSDLHLLFCDRLASALLFAEVPLIACEYRPDARTTAAASGFSGCGRNFRAPAPDVAVICVGLFPAQVPR